MAIVVTTTTLNSLSTVKNANADIPTAKPARSNVLCNRTRATVIVTTATTDTVVTGMVVTAVDRPKNMFKRATVRSVYARTPTTRVPDVFTNTWVTDSAMMRTMCRNASTTKATAAILDTITSSGTAKTVCASTPPPTKLQRSVTPSAVQTSTRVIITAMTTTTVAAVTGTAATVVATMAIKTNTQRAFNAHVGTLTTRNLSVLSRNTRGITSAMMITTPKIATLTAATAVKTTKTQINCNSNIAKNVVVCNTNKY